LASRIALALIIDGDSPGSSFYVDDLFPIFKGELAWHSQASGLPAGWSGIHLGYCGLGRSGSEDITRSVAAVDLRLGVDGPEKIEFLAGDTASVEYSEETKVALLAG
jgi:hypothetical protein